MAKKPPGHPKASAWDRISGRQAQDTLANRDVFEDQQLDRSEIKGKQTATGRTVVAVVAGALTALLVWAVWSVGAMVADSIGESLKGDGVTVSATHYQMRQVNTVIYEYCTLDGPQGAVTDTCYATEDEAKENPPQWYLDLVAQAEADAAAKEAAEGPGPDGVLDYLLMFDALKAIAALLAGLGVFGLLHQLLMRNLDAQNLLNDTTDINQYKGDQHIALPDEVMRKFDWFPDVGAHSGVQVSSMISHVMISNKGLKKVQVAKRADKDILGEDGEVEVLKGEILTGPDDQPLTRTEPLIDEAFGQALFDASALPKKGPFRKVYDTTKIEYNPKGEDRDKLGTYKTVADLINDDWDLPLYEVQRPAGAYIVDTAPVNTMILAITRAGKGQTYIEPVIDMWLREKSPNNMVINDPKGELLVKHFVRATVRGFQVVQFNLINAMKTDIYNPLGMAAEAAREGDATKCALYVENIADVFFPTDGGEDPVWPNAANNAFKRAAYGLIDYYLEEERERRAHAARVNMDPKVLENELDEMWGKVTLYNCYQLFVQLTAKKVKNPVSKLEVDLKEGKFGDDENFDDAAYDQASEEAEKQAFLWEDKPEADMLSLYFTASEALPQNTMRTLINNANNALKSMGAAEKMLASVYGIAITAMSFFTDPTISTLTSGTPSQNVDLGGLSFPRRMGVRFSANYVKRDHLVGMQAVWDAYGDPGFTEPLGPDFDHEDIVSREGWARYYFKGKFPGPAAWLRLRLMNPGNGMLVRTLYFKFTKDHQTSLNGRYFITDPITGEKIVKNGLLVELKRSEDGTYAPGHTTYSQQRLTDIASDNPNVVDGQAHAIIQTTVRYSEQPKVVFLVTPPHLMKYAKLILILVKQLVDLNFDKSYMTKSNQKPLYKTRFMLDELGNLQSEGHGISGLETMLSIGLGQEQQFTLILQTLQQLRDVYGESVDKIVQGNVSNIIFLKSTDDSMLDTLQKMSGTRHVSYIDSKTVTRDQERIVKGMNVEGKVSYTMSTKEEPVISYNDMAFISERNSIVFRAGDAPVWNRNETILPMSWRMFKDTIIHPGHDYSLQTIPTLSTALDFDVRMNQPDFGRMLAKRMEQAILAADCATKYRRAFGYTELDVTRLDPDVYSDEVMQLVDARMREEVADEMGVDPDMIDPDELEGATGLLMDPMEDIEQQREIQRRAEAEQARQQKVYAGGRISRAMLVRPDGQALGGALDKEIVDAYKACRRDLEADRGYFSVDGTGALRSADGKDVYISEPDESEDLHELRRAAAEDGSRVYSDDEDGAVEIGSFTVHPAFYEFLASLGSWEDMARGEFERAMSVRMREDDAA